MGHTHFHAVLVFYAWSAVVAIGGLLLLFVPVVVAAAIVVAGLAGCTWLTLAPLTRRKAGEIAAQSAQPGDSAAAAGPHLDPLDSASVTKETP